MDKGVWQTYVNVNVFLSNAVNARAIQCTLHKRICQTHRFKRKILFNILRSKSQRWNNEIKVFASKQRRTENMDWNDWKIKVIDILIINWNPLFIIQSTPKHELLGQFIYIFFICQMLLPKATCCAFSLYIWSVLYIPLKINQWPCRC